MNEWMNEWMKGHMDFAVDDPFWQILSWTVLLKPVDVLHKQAGL